MSHGRRWGRGATFALLLACATSATGCGAAGGAAAGEGASATPASTRTPTKPLHDGTLIVAGKQVGGDADGEETFTGTTDDERAPLDGAAEADVAPVAEPAPDEVAKVDAPPGDDPPAEVDPFEGMLRVPVAAQVLVAPGEPLAIAPPDHSVLDEHELQAAERGVVQVASMQCGRPRSGSGWMPATDTVVTAAHVVAGADGVVWVRPGGIGPGTRYRGTVSRVDVERGVAVLSVPGLPGTPLDMAPAGTVDDELSGALLGYPRGDRFSLEPARLGPERAESVAMRDGWGRHGASRTVRWLGVRAHPGSAGGPVVDAHGRVVATAFGTVDESWYPQQAAITNLDVAAAVSGAADGRGTPDGPCRGSHH